MSIDPQNHIQRINVMRGNLRQHAAEMDRVHTLEMESRFDADVGYHSSEATRGYQQWVDMFHVLEADQLSPEQNQRLAHLSSTLGRMGDEHRAIGATYTPFGYTYESQNVRDFTERRMAELRQTGETFMVAGHERHFNIVRVRTLPDGGYSYTTYDAGHESVSLGRDEFGNHRVNAVIERRLRPGSDPADLIRSTVVKNFSNAETGTYELTRDYMDERLEREPMRIVTDNAQTRNNCTTMGQRVMLQDITGDQRITGRFYTFMADPNLTPEGLDNLLYKKALAVQANNPGAVRAINTHETGWEPHKSNTVGMVFRYEIGPSGERVPPEKAEFIEHMKREGAQVADKEGKAWLYVSKDNTPHLYENLQRSISLTAGVSASSTVERWRYSSDPATSTMHQYLEFGLGQENVLEVKRGNGFTQVRVPEDFSRSNLERMGINTAGLDRTNHVITIPDDRLPAGFSEHVAKLRTSAEVTHVPRAPDSPDISAPKMAVPAAEVSGPEDALKQMRYRLEAQEGPRRGPRGEPGARGGRDPHAALHLGAQTPAAEVSQEIPTKRGETRNYASLEEVDMRQPRGQRPMRGFPEAPATDLEATAELYKKPTDKLTPRERAAYRRVVSGEISATEAVMEGREPQLSSINPSKQGPRAAIETGQGLPVDAAPAMHRGTAQTTTELRTISEVKPDALKYSPTAVVAANDGRAGQSMTDVADGGGRNAADSFVSRRQATVLPTAANDVDAAVRDASTATSRNASQATSDAAHAIGGVSDEMRALHEFEELGAAGRMSKLLSRGGAKVPVLGVAVAGGFATYIMYKAEKGYNEGKLNDAQITAMRVAILPYALGQAGSLVVGTASEEAIEASLKAAGVPEEYRPGTLRQAIASGAEAAMAAQQLSAVKAELPEPTVAAFIAGMKDKHGITKDGALNDFMKARDAALSEAYWGRDMGAKVGRVPVQPYETAGIIDDAARTYLGMGGTLETAQYAFDKDPALARTKDLINDMLDMVPTTDMKGVYPSGDKRLEALKKLKTEEIKTDDPARRQVLWDQMTVLAADYIKSGRTTEDMKFSYYRIATVVDGAALPELAKNAKMMVVMDGADGTKKDGKLTPQEIGAAMNKMGISYAKTDSDHSSSLNYSEIVSAVSNAKQFQNSNGR